MANPLVLLLALGAAGVGLALATKKGSGQPPLQPPPPPSGGAPPFIPPEPPEELEIPTGGDEVDLPVDWDKVPKQIQDQLLTIMGAGGNDSPGYLKMLANLIENSYNAPATVAWLRAKAAQAESSPKSPGWPTGDQESA